MQDQTTVYIGLWLNERKAKQTFGVNWILGVNDNMSASWIFSSSQVRTREDHVLFSVFLYFILSEHPVGLKEKI